MRLKKCHKLVVEGSVKRKRLDEAPIEVEAAPMNADVPGSASLLNAVLLGIVRRLIFRRLWMMVTTSFVWSHHECMFSHVEREISYSVPGSVVYMVRCKMSRENCRARVPAEALTRDVRALITASGSFGVGWSERDRASCPSVCGPSGPRFRIRGCLSR